MRLGILGHHDGLASHLAALGIDTLVHPVGTADPLLLKDAGLAVVDAYETFFAELEHPRLFLLDLPPGPTIDKVIDAAYVVMEPGDVVFDPSGSYWGDTLRRFRRMRHRSLFYVDLAFLGGELAGPVLVAGDRRGVDLGLPALERIVGQGQVVRAGAAAAAHYALMVRDAVATSVAHALSEARQLLEAYPNHAEAEAVADRLWPAPPAEATGRASWLLDDAVRLEAAVPLMAQSIMLEMGAALDEHRSPPTVPRVGPFVHPDDIL